MKKALVFGGSGFIGSHLIDALKADGWGVSNFDDFSSGKNVEPSTQMKGDVANYRHVLYSIKTIQPDVVFNLAAIARTPWCIDEPRRCFKVNVMGTLNVLEACREANVPRIVLASSNVVLAAQTPYRASKEAVEALTHTYAELYGQSVIALRFSNVYGSRQSEEGPSPNVFAALRKSKKENGYLEITGDGEQSRDYTHVSDIVRGLLCAANSKHTGVVDLCTGINTSLNVVTKFFNCEVKYIPERRGDMKHMVQDPKPAFDILGWKAKVKLADGIVDCL